MGFEIWDLGFEIWDFAPGGWWLRAESRPVRAGLVAAARAVPTLLSAWTFHMPPPAEEPLARGDERIALLWDLGRRLAGEAALSV